MKRKILSVAIVATTIFGCTKEDNTLTSSTNSSNNETSRNGDAVIGTRSLVVTVSNGVVVDVFCSNQKGCCLPTLVITAKIAYGQLLSEIKADNQMAFFNTISYADIFGVEEIPHIQDALEKGHLKIKLINGSSANYFLFLKPQHEHVDPDKLADKVEMTIPVIE